MFAYRIERACLWFCKNDIIEVDVFQKYFTNHALNELIKYGYVKIISK